MAARHVGSRAVTFSSQAGLATFRGHKAYMEARLVDEARFRADVVEPAPWTPDFKARNWAYRTEETDG